MAESKRIKKIRPYYQCVTLNLIVINVNEQLSQIENAHLTVPTSYTQRHTKKIIAIFLSYSVVSESLKIGRAHV